jgi:hypothetical protein
MAVNHSITQSGKTEDFLLQVARGQVLNHRHIFKYGYNAEVGASAEHIWFQGGTFTWPSGAATLEVTSTDDTNDKAAGTGALTVTLEGLDANYAEISETVTMTGQTAATTTNSFLRCHRMYVATAGSTNTNQGTIYAANSSGTHSSGVPTDLTLVYATIGATEGQTLQALYTIPAGYTGYMYNIIGASADGTNSSVVTMKSREVGGAFRTKNKFVIFKGTYPIQFAVPQAFAEKTDIEVTATGNATETDVAITFDIILVKN